MKPLALKLFVAASTAFAVGYLFFLGSAAYALYVPWQPGMPNCATGIAWSLEGSAIFFAPMALVADVGLWFVRRKKLLAGAILPKLTMASLLTLLLCALVNLLIFIPIP
jgi:hypothetical protein